MKTVRAASTSAARVSAPPGRRPRRRVGSCFTVLLTSSSCDTPATFSTISEFSACKWGCGRGRSTVGTMGPMVTLIDTHAAVSGLGVVTPTREEFHQLAAERRVIPVVRRVLADAETPVGVYRKLAQGRPNTFLLESAENGRAWSRWSFVGVSSTAVLPERDGVAHWTGTRPVGLPADGDPLEVLRETVRLLPTAPLPGLPPLTGGMVGFIGYDAVRRLERLPDLTTDDL